ncbi:MAG: thiamine phosphate synthase [Chloroflexi bacterium]|nr:thiamine phosphate synthase [Chloroflexota bacterium]
MTLSPEARQSWRIIDANLNRIGEGLRVLEDIARLALNDTSLSQELKTLRHGLVRCEWPAQLTLLQSRDAAGDVGADMVVPGEETGRDLSATIVANARRVQEALRVIEEMAKMAESSLGGGLDSAKFKHTRFRLYTMERELLGRLLRQNKVKQLRGLYAIVDTSFLRGRSHIQVAREIIAGGARILQLRDKSSTKKELLPIAMQLRRLCAENRALFIVNDYLDIALATDADGLHVGQEDLPVAAARKLLPIDKLLGCSARTVALATEAEAAGADYMAVGALHPTTSKEQAEVVGLDRLRQIKQAVKVPVVAIGGITPQNAAEVRATGADAIAVISALLLAENVTEATRQIIAALRTRPGCHSEESFEEG